MADHGESEPLLGHPGDASQVSDQPIYHNLILGTGILAQFGIWVLAALVWSGIFSHNLIFFSAHPLLNSTGIVLLVQAALILQPTHTAEQKKLGTYIHSALINLGLLCFLAAFIIIEINKSGHPGNNLKSVHSILGLTTYILLLIQWAVGATQFFYPQLYGSVENAKKVYKYHRASGYVMFAMLTATVCAATWTDYNLGMLKIHHWSVIVASVILLAGLYARIKKQKLGL